MGRGIPPLRIKIMLESNPLKSTMLVRRLAVAAEARPRPRGGPAGRRRRPTPSGADGCRFCCDRYAHIYMCVRIMYVYYVRIHVCMCIYIYIYITCVTCVGDPGTVPCDPNSCHANRVAEKGGGGHRATPHAPLDFFHVIFLQCFHLGPCSNIQRSFQDFNIDFRIL